MNMAAETPNIESHFKVHHLLESLADAFRKFSSVVVYEIENGDRYSVAFDPWDCMPSISDGGLKAGPDFSVKQLPNGKGSFGLEFNLREIKFNVSDIRLHRNIDVEKSTAHIFRNNAKWLVIMGTNLENRAEISQQVTAAFEKMHKKPSNDRSGPSR